MKMTVQPSLPVYMLIRQYVVGIASQPENNGKQLISIRKLCKLFNVSHLTVMKALKELIDEDYLVTRPGIGTFVNSKSRTPFAKSYPKSRQVGLIVRAGKHVRYDHLYQRMISGIFSNLSSNGAMAQPITPFSLDAHFLDIVRTMSLDGIIWVNPSQKALQCVQAMDDAGFPLVTTTIHYPGIQSKHCVASDFHQAGYLAGEFLIDKGHKQILSVFNKNDKSDKAVLGMKDACEKNDISFKDEFFLQGGEELIDKVDMMLNLGIKFSAIFADGNFCLPLRSVFAKHGIYFSTIELVAIEDAFSLMLEDQPTLVSCPLIEMGRRSVELLTRLIDDKNRTPKPETVLLDWELTNLNTREEEE